MVARCVMLFPLTGMSRIVEKNPSKFKIDNKELSGRRNFIEQTRDEVKVSTGVIVAPALLTALPRCSMSRREVVCGLPSRTYMMMKEKMNISRGRDRDRTARQVGSSWLTGTRGHVLTSAASYWWAHRTLIVSSVCLEAGGFTMRLTCQQLNTLVLLCMADNADLDAGPVLNASEVSDRIGHQAETPLLENSPARVPSSHGSTKYSKLENELDSPNRQFLDDTIQQQGGMLRVQDDQLDLISDSVGTLKTVSRQITSELDEQAVMLDEFGNELENTDSKIDSTMKKVAKVLHMSNADSAAQGHVVIWCTKGWRSPSHLIPASEIACGKGEYSISLCAVFFSSNNSLYHSWC
ncbi:hypothetical protein PR048_032146 [Dryococelus australis]|uniref:t-SNARE coiled-coil homology domain-containing protein n=1 Tax=Dryococelus australis TaxID=614101 RepID=A0ABQ9G1D9_9NEOP|nr:hypothetical protein PR048_032146 [Dryococelus australis]